MVAWEMEECSKCDKISCAWCINNWHKWNTKSPCCEQKADFKQLNRNLKNMFEAKQYKFKCQKSGCNEKFAYQDAFNHTT